MSCSLWILCGSHQSNERPASQLFTMLRSVLDQNNSLGKEHFDMRVLVSISFEDGLSRKEHYALRGMFVHEHSSLLRWTDVNQKTSKYAHLYGLVNQIPTQSDNNNWIIFTEDDSIWCHQRLFYLGECARLNQSDARAVMDPMYVVNVTGLNASTQEQVMSLWENNELEVYQLHLDDNGPILGHGDNPPKAWSFMVNAKVTRDFFIKTPPHLLDFVYCDMIYCRHVINHRFINERKPTYITINGEASYWHIMHQWRGNNAKQAMSFIPRSVVKEMDVHFNRCLPQFFSDPQQKEIIVGNILFSFAGGKHPVCNTSVELLQSLKPKTRTLIIAGEINFVKSLLKIPFFIDLVDNPSNDGHCPNTLSSSEMIQMSDQMLDLADKIRKEMNP